MIHILLALSSALAYGVAPLVYRPALVCTSIYRVQSTFSLYSIALGLLLPWRSVDAVGILYAITAGAVGGVVGGWLYLNSIKIGGAAVGNISSSLYIVLIPLFAGRVSLIPAAFLVLAGIALASAGEAKSRFGALYGVGAAFVWTLTITIYAMAVETLGPGGAATFRGLTVFAMSTTLARGVRLCKPLRVSTGGFLDTFLGFGFYTLALDVGDYVTVAVVVSIYPLVTTLLESPTSLRKVAGGSLTVVGLMMVFI